jgi:Rieske Fe-S protein
MTNQKNKPTTCNCNCSNEKVIDTSRREFIRKASAITLVGGTAFILQACGGGSPTSSDNGDNDNTGGGNTGGGNTGGGNTGEGNTGEGNTGGETGNGYSYDAATKTITIDITKIHQSLQNIGGGIALNSNETFDNRGIIVLRTSTSGVRALSRVCTHQGQSVIINSSANNLLCPSHNSIFDLNGNVISGPASGSLTKYNATLSGSIITITQN